MNPLIWIKRAIAAFFLAIIWVYQKLLSPILPASCIYYPTCSNYAVEAIQRHGPLMGLLLATKRILSCHPFHQGGHDPVPDQASLKTLFKNDG